MNNKENLNIDVFFTNKLSILGVEMSKQIILDKKKELKQALDTKNSKAKILTEIKSTINKMGMDIKTSVVVDKIMESDNVVASFFFKRGNISSKQKSDIVVDYLKEIGINKKQHEEVMFISHTMGSLAAWRNLPQFIDKAKQNPKTIFIVYYEGSKPNAKFNDLLSDLYSNKNVIKIDEYIKENSNN